MLWYEMGDISMLRHINPGHILCVDIETTGLDPRQDEVLQLSIVDATERVVLNEYYAPARLRSWPRAQRIHGIPPERVWGLPSLGEKAKEITLTLSEAELLVGYNLTFDLRFITNAGVRINRCPHFDVMKEAAPVFGRWSAAKKSYCWCGLKECASLFEVVLHGHDARSDALAAVQCFNVMVGRSGSGDNWGQRGYLDAVASHGHAGGSRRGRGAYGAK